VFFWATAVPKSVLFCFIDETWIKPNISLIRGWSPRGKRLRTFAPHGHWRTRTFLGYLRNDRLTAPCLRRTGERLVGDGARLIRSNEADIAICVETEACEIKVSLAGFAAARSLSTGFNETPEKVIPRVRDGQTCKFSKLGRYNHATLWRYRWGIGDKVGRDRLEGSRLDWSAGE